MKMPSLKKKQRRTLPRRPSKDPTRTISLRKSFIAEVDKRFRLLAHEIKLLQNELPDTDDIINIKEVNDFKKRLESLYNFYILEDSTQNKKNKKWWLLFLLTAYHRGIMMADNEVRKLKKLDERQAGTPFGRSGRILDDNTESIKELRSRGNDTLKAIKDAFLFQVTNVLFSTAMTDREKIDYLVDRIRKIGRTKTRSFAQTETTRAHIFGKIDDYKSHGVIEALALGEWTLGPSKSGPCPYCRAHAGLIYPILVLRSMIPAHNNCRCSIVAVSLFSK